MTRKLKQLFVAVPAVAFTLGAGAALAGSTIQEAGTISCVMDKWDETEKEKGHKVAQAANRCVLIPDDKAAAKVTEDCKGTYEYLPDGSWKAAGTCTDKYPGGDTVTSHLGGGLALEGVHLPKDRRHRKISGRERRRHIYVRKPHRHPRRGPLQRHARTAVASPVGRRQSRAPQAH